MKKKFINKKIIITLIIDIVFLLLIFYIDNKMDVLFIIFIIVDLIRIIYSIYSTIKLTENMDSVNED
ncbi:hypothetical protein [Thomasclavelia cocleata]|uniref:hypothetical protein n=1 Tax=Thomasclavelia cocleata TaxID=69824 RepID=UPI00242E055A|nr:hypothetical protein [Thomasclavelia cocleata]